jgi:hypothetical protein
MKKKGQTLGLILISSIFFFIVGMMVINFLMPEVTTFRTDLNCATPAAITDGTKLLCLVGDTVVIYWIILVFSILIGSIVARMYM